MIKEMGGWKSDSMVERYAQSGAGAFGATCGGVGRDSSVAEQRELRSRLEQDEIALRARVRQNIAVQQFSMVDSPTKRVLLAGSRSLRRAIVLV
jgi:hypothetical protein